MKKCLLLIVILGFFQISITAPFHLINCFGKFCSVVDDEGLKCLLETALESDQTSGLINSCSAIDGVPEMISNSSAPINREVISRMSKNPECRSEIVSTYVISQLSNGSCKNNNLIKFHDRTWLRNNYSHLF